MSAEGIVGIVVAALLALLLMWLNDKFLVPWQAKRSVARLLADVKAGKRPKARDFTHEINFNDQGFSVSSLKPTKSTSPQLRWVEIQGVQVFKRDLFSVDMVCLFLAKSDGTGMELNEDMACWLEFAEALPKHLPGCQPFEKWHGEVVVPAFETKLAEIYRRQPAANSDSREFVKLASQP